MVFVRFAQPSWLLTVDYCFNCDPLLYFSYRWPPLLQPSQDLSPIYEEIHGGSRSSVSSGSGGSGIGLRKSQNKIGAAASATANHASTERSKPMCSQPTTASASSRFGHWQKFYSVFLFAVKNLVLALWVIIRPSSSWYDSVGLHSFEWHLNNIKRSLCQ